MNHKPGDILGRDEQGRLLVVLAIDRMKRADGNGYNYVWDWDAATPTQEQMKRAFEESR